MGKRKSLLMESYSEYGMLGYEKLRHEEAFLGAPPRVLEFGTTKPQKIFRVGIGRLPKFCAPFTSRLRDLRSEILEAARHGKSHIADLFAGNIFLMHITAAPVSGRRNRLKPSLGLLQGFSKKETQPYAKQNTA